MTIGTEPNVVDSSLFIPDFRYRRKDAVLGELVARAHRAESVSNADLLRETLSLREKLGSTSIGKGAAVPHARSIAVLQPRVVIGRSRRGIDWGAPDGEPVRLAALVLSPAEAGDEAHLDFVARAASVLRQQRNRQKLIDADNFDDVAGLFRDVTP